MVLVTIWPSKGHNGPTSDLLSLNNGHISRTVMCLGKSGHLGAVLCRDYENGLDDYMVIKNHDGPNGDLISLHYIYTSAISCVIGDFGPSLRCNMSSL